MNRRVKKLWHLLNKQVDGMLITSPENVRYLCGFSGTEGTLLLTHQEDFFLTDGRYTTQAHEQVNGFTIVTFREKWKEIGTLIKKLRLAAPGFEARNLSVAFISELEKEFSPVTLKPVGEVLDQLRIIKDASEIALLKKAAQIAGQSLKGVITLLKPGVREREIAIELEYLIRRNGGEVPAFQFIVASGHRGALPHGVASDKKIEKGDMVIIDYGAVFKGYASDETCTFLMGKPTRKQSHIYDIVRKAHDRAIAAVRPGKTPKEIDAAARNFIEKHGYKKYFNHGTGHGIGLAIHEPPRVSYLSDGVVQKDMVFTIEPGIYFPGWGGVRIEDTVVVTEKGCTVITTNDKDLTIID